MSKSEYQFATQYEYEGESAALEIAATIKKNFLFPCWAQRYMATLKDEGKV